MSGRYRALTLGIVSCVLLVAFEATAVNTAMPVAARDLDGLGLYAFAFSGYFTASLLAMVVSGEWSDKRGPLGPLTAGIGTFGVGLVIAGTAQHMWGFVAGRAVQGLGGGLLIVALYVVVGRAYPERLRPSVFAAFSSAWVLPSIVGPVISGTVTQQLGWRWVFLSIPVLIVLPVALMLPQLRRLQAAGAQDAPDAPDAVHAAAPGTAADGTAADGTATDGTAATPGSTPAAPATDGTAAPAPRAWELNRRRILLALALAVGAGLLQYAGQLLDLYSLLPAAAGLLLLVPAVTRLLPRGTFRAARGLPTVILLRGIAAGAFFAAEAFIPLMLVTQRHLSPTLAGASLTSGGLSWALGSWIQGRSWADRHRSLLIRSGLLMSALAIAGAGLVLFPAVPAYVVALFWTVGGMGMGLTIASLGVLMLSLSAADDTGENSASLQVSDALGNVLLTGTAGVLFSLVGTDTRGGFAAIFATMAAVALVGAAVCSRTRPRR
ncbi:MFS transporter [Streptacidiphilus cavernicola]|uniref:MFS transporter n=1 Tax=Streptacidiphilus cavernicola TaxID=3342716 RepID=A0ABV6W010_9ACTN